VSGNVLENAKDFLEKHPYTVAGVIVAVGGLFLLLTQSSTLATSSTTDPNELQIAELNAQLQSQSNQINGQLQLAQIQSAAQSAQISAQSSLAGTQTADQYQATLAQIAASLQENTNQINGQQAINASNNATALAIVQANDQATVNQSALVAATQQQIAQYSTTANIDIAAINANQNIQISKYVNQTQLGIAQAQSQAQVGIANANASALTNVSLIGNAGNIAGAIGSIVGFL
jgi:hypothetical protein